LVVGPGIAGKRAIPIGWHLGSVLVGYARTWGPIVTVCGIWLMVRSDAAEGWVTMLAGAIATIAGIRAANVSNDARARRRVYEKHALYPVDPAHLGDRKDELAEELRAEIVGRARAAITRGYRDAAGGIGLDDVPAPELVERIAAETTIQDQELLGAAMTLARITGPRSAHDALWARLRR
jgi:hypothetical protein